MGFAGWDAAKEHKFRKPRKGFEKQKNLQKQLLMENKGLSLKTTKKLKAWRIKKIQKIKKWKILKELTLIFLILIPIVILIGQRYVSSFERRLYLSDRQFMYEVKVTDERGYLVRGYEALDEKNYKSAIYFFSKMLDYEVLRDDGKYALLGTYIELCQNHQSLCDRAELLIEEFIQEKGNLSKDKLLVEKFKEEVQKHNHEMIAYYKQIGLIDNKLVNQQAPTLQKKKEYESQAFPNRASPN